MPFRIRILAKLEKLEKKITGRTEDGLEKNREEIYFLFNFMSKKPLKSKSLNSKKGNVSKMTSENMQKNNNRL